MLTQAVEKKTKKQFEKVVAETKHWQKILEWGILPCVCL